MSAYGIVYKVVVFGYGEIVGVDRRFDKPEEAIERVEQLRNECTERGITFKVIVEYKPIETSS